MDTRTSANVSKVLSRIGQGLEQHLKDGRLTVGAGLAELDALGPVFEYMFDGTGVHLSDATIRIDGKVTVTGNASVYGVVGVYTTVEFETQDDRILFRLTAQFPRTTKLAPPGLTGFSVNDIHLSVETFLDDRLLNVFLGGTLHVQKIEIPILIQFPTVSENWLLTSTLEVRLPLLRDVAAFLGGGLSAWVPATLERAGTFAVRDLQAIFNPAAGSVDLISARVGSVEASTTWDLIPGHLSIREPVLELGIAHLTDSRRRGAIGSIAGILSIGSVDLHVTAGKFSEAEPWVFRGGLLPGESISLTAIANQLLPKEVSLPGELPDVRFTDIDMEVTPQTGEFSLSGKSTGDWTIPLGVGQLKVVGLGLSVERVATADEKKGMMTTCQIDGQGTLTLQVTDGVSADLSGTVQFQAGRECVGFTFKAQGPEGNRLTLEIPTGVPTIRPTVQFTFDEIAIDRTAEGWRVHADASTQFAGLPAFMTAPIPGTQLSLVPQKPRIWSLTAGRGEVAFSIDRLWEGELPRIPLPSITVKGKELSLGIMCLDVNDWKIRLGKQSPADSKIALQATIQVAVSEEINRVFGVESDGRTPWLKFFKSFTQGVENPLSKATGIRLGLSEKGITALPQGSPINPVQPDDQGLYHISLGPGGQFGKLSTRMPMFRFDGVGWTAAGEWHIEEPLKLPLMPAKAALTQAGLGLFAQVLPEAVSLDDIKLVENNRLTFGPWLDKAAKHPGVKIPKEIVQALQALEKTAEQLLERTPGRFNEYLDFTMPTDLAFAIEVRGGGGLKLDVTTRTNADARPTPLKLLLPFMDPMTGIPELLGVELISLSVGEILGGALFLLEVEGKFDRFDLIAMALCLSTGHLADGKTSSKAFQRSYTFDRLLAVIPAATPVPVPLFYKEIGISYYGWEMLRFETHWHFPLPDVGLFEAIGLFSELKDFFTRESYKLSPDSPPTGFKLPFTIGPNYIQLPPYLGGKVIGTEQGLPQWSVWKSLANLLNGLKTGDPQDLLSALPVEARIGEVGVDLGPFSANAGVAVTTPGEFRTAIVQGKVRTEPGKRFGERLRALGTGPDKQIAALLPKAGDRQPDENGLIILLLTDFGIPDVVTLQVAFGLAAIGSKGFGTGVRLAGVIGKTLRMAVQGTLIVEPTQLRISGDTGIWWNDTRLTNVGLATMVNKSGLTTQVTLTLTPKCSFSGLWTIGKDAMAIGGSFHWAYGGKTPLNANGLATFSGRGLTLSTTQVETAALHGIKIKKLEAILPAIPGKPLGAAVALEIPEALSTALRGEIDAAARRAKGELDSARQLALEALSALKGYELSVEGVKNMTIAICNGAVRAITTSIKKLPAEKKYGKWPLQKTVKVRAEANKEVAPYIRTLNGFAQRFGKSTKSTLAKDVIALVNWAGKNKRHPVKRYGFTVTTVTILSDQTVNRLNDIKRNVPQWVARLPEKDIGLTLSGAMIEYAKGTVNDALNDIAASLDKAAKNVPTLTGISLETNLTGLPTSGVKVRMEVTRDSKVKTYDTSLNFANPAAAAADLFKLFVKDLGTSL